MRKIMTLALIGSASPALAASGPFFSLGNTDFVVLIGFLVFIGVLVYFKVFPLLTGMLDKRADGIRDELDEARKIREEAQTLLASYERKQQDVQAQADRIVATAKEEAAGAAEKAKDDLKTSIARRLAAAEDQLASAQASAIKEVRDRAAAIAVAAAREVVADQMTAKDASAMIDASIKQVGERLQ